MIRPQGICRFLVVLLLGPIPTGFGLAADSSSTPSTVNTPDPVVNTPTPDYSIRPLTILVPPAVIYFPPDPPPLDGAIVRPTVGRLAEPAPPAELTAYVHEFFYAPLSTLLLKKELSGSQRRRLEAYRVERDALIEELRIELGRQRDADAKTRRLALAALAQRQAGRLAALEVEAEALRHNLVDGFYGWFAQREWHLGGRPHLEDFPSEIEQVMRAYAAYHDGLLPAQRGLLREIALEVFRQNEEHAVAGREFFFSPEISRVARPDHLPAALSAQVAEYEDKKGALKKELYDAVHDYERASALRGNTLKADVIGQGPRLAALENLAEEIRIGLAALPSTSTTKASSLPPVMKARVAAFVQNRTAVQAETMADIEAIHRAAATPDGTIVLTYSLTATDLTFGVSFQPQKENAKKETGPLSLSGEAKRKMVAASVAMTQLASVYRARIAEVTQEEDALRRDLASMLTQPGDPEPRAALSSAIRDAMSEENSEAFRDYRSAVFEPGLSIEQRRLLFGHALMELKLPLPPGSLQPSKAK